MCGSAQADGLGHVAIGGRDWQRDVARHMHHFALGQQGKTGKGVGVFAAGEHAEPADVGVMNNQARPIATGPGQFFGPGRRQLA